MISSTADYAIRALLLLARQAEGQLLRADDVAAAIGAPRNYLAKTLYELAKAGLVKGTRGPTGGYTLAVPAHAITLARVADLFDDSRPNPRCLLGNAPCNAARPCAAHERWTAIVAARRAALADTTIADLLAPAEPARRAAGRR